jgi:hypothetical protein
MSRGNRPVGVDIRVSLVAKQHEGGRKLAHRRAGFGTAAEDSVEPARAKPSNVANRVVTATKYNLISLRARRRRRGQKKPRQGGE